MNLSISAIKLFKACRRAYELKYVLDVVPIETSEALQTGITYHSGIEKYYQSNCVDVPDIVDKESAMVNAYVTYVAPKMPKFEPEQWFNIDINAEDKFVGRLDGLCEGGIVEHKTTSQTTDEYFYDLAHDEQLLAYLWATGQNTAYFTVCRKPTIRQKVGESTEDYAKRCYEWYNGVDNNSKIAMNIIQYDDAEIAAYGDEIKTMFDEIRAGKNYYRNKCHCKAWGRTCEYAPICNNYDPAQQYVGFTRREVYR